MIGTYKEFYKFVNSLDSSICKLWEDFNNRNNPKIGEFFLIETINDESKEITYLKGIFKKIEFDGNFEKGVAFNYIFDVDGKEVNVYSINNVYDGFILDIYEHNNLYGFWKRCKLIDKNENLSIKK